MSRYSTSAVNDGSTQTALGFFNGLVSLDFGLTTVSSCFRIWLEIVELLVEASLTSPAHEAIDLISRSEPPRIDIEWY
jgi:hypothetical protein